MREPNFLTGSGLDRAAERRRDEAWLRARWKDGASRVYVAWRSRHLVTGDSAAPTPCPLPAPELARFVVDADEPGGPAWAFLGLDAAGRARLALDVSALERPEAALALPEKARFEGLRELAPLLSREDGARLAYVSGLLSWHRRHRYCGSCGAPTRLAEGGHARRCRGDRCGRHEFPRTDPAVIMLVVDGDRCLLGRAPRWRPGLYSALAGFVEPGESLEEAVAREVREETGIDVGDVAYHSSQPWPFPSSLMLGFVAQATTSEIRLGDDELEDARWFRREELEGRPVVELPTPISIARRLIDDWLARRV